MTLVTSLSIAKHAIIIPSRPLVKRCGFLFGHHKVLHDTDGRSLSGRCTY